MGLETRDLVVTPPGPANPLLDLPAHIQEAQAEIPHQPLVGRRGGEIETTRPQVEGYCAGSVDDVGINEGAVRVRDVGNAFQIVLIAVGGRYETDCDELRFVVDRR